MISDVEEVIDRPFGEPDSIFLGSGGEDGIQMLAGESKYDKAYSVFQYLSVTADDATLTSFGLYREDGESFARVSLNGRKLTSADVDNIACKVSVYYGKTTGSRLVILCPSLHNLYDVPIVPQWKVGFDHLAGLLRICGDAVKVFQDAKRVVAAEVTTGIHPEFQYQGEPEKWPRICSHYNSKWSLNGKRKEQKATTKKQKRSNSL
jgi:hypothetical protein